MFRSFAARLTRAYVLLALGIIAAIVLVSTALSFLLYVRTLNDAVAATEQRVQARVQAYDVAHKPLATVAPQLIAELNRGRIELAVFDANRQFVAGTPQSQTVSRRLAGSLGSVLGLRRSAVRIPGGVVVITPDLDRFGASLLRYWTSMLGVALVAVLAAWFVGRRITRRAIGPLGDVTMALQGIAGGDFQPQPISARGDELRELTHAYNEVAHRLTTETAERQRTDAQMRQFVADAGHELRTPLTVVMGYVDALQKGLVTDPAGVERIYETILDESRRMRGVIEKLILLARLERPAAPVTTALDVGDLLHAIATELTPVGGERVQVSAQPALTVLAEESELHEALKNVIDNALKYAPQSPVEVAARSYDSTIMVTVADRGPGMNEQDRAHAFDRFYRGDEKSATEGSGLGLAIAKRAVERMGGSIGVESEPGAGTRITIALPMKPA